MRPPLAAALLSCLAACRPAPASALTTEPGPTEEASGPAARWSYEVRVDAELERLDLGLCIEGPVPRRLLAGDPGAIEFVLAARVRGGPELARDRQGLRVETLGESGCVDIQIDLQRATAGSGRDSGRYGDTLMLGPDRWLWYPAVVPEPLEARARFELGEGVAATVPWPRIDDDDPEQWRSLDRTSFGWNAWVAFGHYQPLTFTAAGCEFEVAVLAGPRRVSDAGIEAWIRTAAEANAQLHGRFPRDHVAVVVVPSSTWGDSPVAFGMARRGGGGSVMLLLDDEASDSSLPGEWVAIHELLHLGMPLVADAWMAEGFVTYYTTVVRARAELLETPEPDLGDLGGTPHERQIAAALRTFYERFADRAGLRTLAVASETMRQFGGYRRVYWGGAALAYDLDVSIREASNNQRSLDDLILALAPLAFVRRRYAAAELLAKMDAITDGWVRTGELEHEISPSAIATRHLQAKATPKEVQALRGIAVDSQDGRIRLLEDPIDEVQIRTGLFSAKILANADPE